MAVNGTLWAYQKAIIEKEVTFAEGPPSKKAFYYAKRARRHGIFAIISPSYIHL